MKSIKVVGISGCGKSTVIKGFRAVNAGFAYMSYGAFFVKYAEEADKKWERCLSRQKQTVIMDDHLEWGTRDFVTLFKAEGTCALLHITADVQKIMGQRILDKTRQRSLEVEVAEREQAVSRQRALSISKSLGIPFYELLNASKTESVSLLERIAQEVG